jgi:integrase
VDPAVPHAHQSLHRARTYPTSQLVISAGPASPPIRTAHAAASFVRAWAIWDQFFSFPVADEVVWVTRWQPSPNPRSRPAPPKPSGASACSKRSPPASNALVGPGLDVTSPSWPRRCGLRLSELLGLDLGPIDGREGERRLKVTGKGSKMRFVPIEGPLELVINQYLSTRKVHSSNGKLTQA